jgi:RND family efflux transporter MFP subunit
MVTYRPPFTSVSLVALTALYGAGCGEAHSQPTAAAPPPVPVRVVSVERASLDRPLRAVGRLGQKRSLTLAFKNGGTIRSLFVQEGATVRKGQRLAVVDRTEIDAQVAQAEAAMEKADRDKARVDKLHAGAAAAQNDADNAATAADIAHANLEVARYNQNAAVLIAPEDGRIDKRLAEVGEVVGPGRPIYTLSGSSSGLVARVGVVDRELVDLRIGDRADVEVDALAGKRFAATVSEIARVPSIPSGTYEIELRVADGSELLAAGMTVKVDVQRRPTTPLPVVPLRALVDADGAKAAVYVIAPLTPKGFTVHRTAITIAAFSGDRVSVQSGLGGTEQVVSEGAAFVEPGRRVQPLTEVADARR